MIKAARQIVESQGLDIRLHYLNVSRYALRSAQYHLQGDACVDYICTNGIDMTFNKLMKRTGIDETLIDAVATRTGFENKREEILTYNQIVSLRDLLRQDKEFLEAVFNDSREKYRNTIGYLRQEGLMDRKSIAVVDTGWIGTIQQTLTQLVESYLGRHYINVIPMIDGYYFGLYEVPGGVEKNKYHSFYFGPQGKVGRKAHFSNSLMEAILSAPDGMTLGYEYLANENYYKPIESDIKNPNRSRIEIEGELLDQYMKDYKASDALSNKQIYQLLKPFMSWPTAEAVDYWGSYQFCDDILESQMQNVAADLSDEDIKNQRLIRKLLNLMGLHKVTIHESAWLEGSIVRLGGKVKSNLRHARLYKYLLYIRKSIKSGQ